MVPDLCSYKPVVVVWALQVPWDLFLQFVFSFGFVPLHHFFFCRRKPKSILFFKRFIFQVWNSSAQDLLFLNCSAHYSRNWSDDANCCAKGAYSRYQWENPPLWQIVHCQRNAPHEGPDFVWGTTLPLKFLRYPGIIQFWLFKLFLRRVQAPTARFEPTI